MQSYPSPMHRAYIVKMIPFTFPNVFHIINTETKVTHSSYDDVLKARSIMRDLNAVAGRISRMSKKASHLRVVK